MANQVGLGFKLKDEIVGTFRALAQHDVNNKLNDAYR